MLDTINISYKEFVNNPEITGNVKLTDVLETIQNGDHKISDDDTIITVIEEARLEFSNNGKSATYSQLKSYLPVVTFAGTFKNKFDLKSIDKLSGLMYCDIDKLNSKELYKTKELLKTLPFVVAYWLSPSSAGLGFLVAVDNLTAENYSETYKRLSLTYFDNKLDSACQDISRKTYITFDPSIYINQSFTQLNINDLTKVSPTICSPVSSGYVVSGFRTSQTLGDTFGLEVESNEKVKASAKKRERLRKIRKNNVQDYLMADDQGEWLEGSNCKFFEEKVKIVSYFHPLVLKGLSDGTKGNRARTFWAQACNLLYLNPWATLDELLVEQRKINVNRLADPLPDWELVKQTQAAFKTKETRKDFGLKGYTERRILWDMVPDPENLGKRCNVLLEIKRKNVGEVKSLLSYRKNVEKVLQAVGQLQNEGKDITVSEISKLSGVYKDSVIKVLNTEGIKRKESIEERLEHALKTLSDKNIVITRKTLKEESRTHPRTASLFFKANIDIIEELNETIKNNLK